MKMSKKSLIDTRGQYMEFYKMGYLDRALKTSKINEKKLWINIQKDCFLAFKKRFLKDHNE